VGSTSEDTATFFQLSPFHNVFRGVNGKPTLFLANVTVTVGLDGRGAALGLEGTQLNNALFTHHSSENEESTFYRQTAYRRVFESQVTIEKIELSAEE
jgi:hypothetical protein